VEAWEEKIRCWIVEDLDHGRMEEIRGERHKKRV
jgi:hypothetical protein